MLRENVIACARDTREGLRRSDGVCRQPQQYSDSKDHGKSDFDRSKVTERSCSRSSILDEAHTDFDNSSSAGVHQIQAAAPTSTLPAPRGGRLVKLPSYNSAMIMISEDKDEEEKTMNSIN